MDSWPHTDESYCVCAVCLRESDRTLWRAMPPADRELERLRRLLNGVDFWHVHAYLREGWELGQGAGELHEEDLETIRRYLIARVVRAGGGTRALAELHRALKAAAANAESVGPELVRDDPELCVEWYESEGGHYWGGYIVNSEGYDYLEHLYVEEWVLSLEELLRALSEGDLPTADAPDPVARFVEFLLDLERAAYPPTAPPKLTYRPFHRPDLGPIVRTGPPAGTWANLPQVLPAAA